MRIFFIENSYTKCCQETSPRAASKKTKLNVPLDQYQKLLYSLYILYAKFWAIKIY